MSLLQLKYYGKDIQTVILQTESFPQPSNQQTNILNEIYTGYVQKSSSYSKLYDEFYDSIGYVTFDNTISNLGYNQKIYVTENATYFINGRGSISYTYSWESISNSVNFCSGTSIATRILASTDKYYNKQGPIAINVNDDGTRNVTILFNS